MYYSKNIDAEKFIEQLSKLLIKRENIEGYFLTPQIGYTNNKKIQLYFQCNVQNKIKLICLEI